MERLLRQQHQVSDQRPMQVDDTSASSSIQTVTGETVALYYSNSGTRTVDAGQAAGTAVVGQLAFKNILDVDGSRIATFNDTSLSFTGNCFTTEVKYPYDKGEPVDFDTWANKLSAVTANFANGEYCVDYRSGTIYGVKATTTSSLTSTTYKINQAQAGGTSSLPSEVQAEGQAAHDAAVSGNPLLVGFEAADFDGSSLPNAVNAEGDAVRAKASLYGVQYVMSVNEDGSAISAGASSTTSQYRATTNGGYDGTVVYASASTLTVSGTPFTLQNEDLVYVREVDATGNTAEIWVNGSGGVHMEISSGTLTKSGGSDFSANGVYELGYNGQNKGYTSATTSFRGEEIDPLSEHHVEDTLADVTNETSGTNYYYIDMDGYKYDGIQIDTSGTTPVDTLTITVEASLQDDGTAAASCSYDDVTLDWFGVASWVDQDVFLQLDEVIVAKYIRIKTVTAGGNNDADYTIYNKRLY